MLTMNYKVLRENFGRPRKRKRNRQAQTKPKSNNNCWARSTIWSMESSEPQKQPRKPSEQSSGTTVHQTYEEQLRDPRWLKKRAHILRRDNYKCVLCGADHDLHVHHTEYRSGKKAWEHPNSVLVTLCKDCHMKVHSDLNHNLNPYRKNN